MTLRYRWVRRRETIPLAHDPLAFTFPRLVSVGAAMGTVELLSCLEDLSRQQREARNVAMEERAGVAWTAKNIAIAVALDDLVLEDHIGQLGRSSHEQCAKPLGATEALLPAHTPSMATL